MMLNLLFPIMFILCPQLITVLHQDGMTGSANQEQIERKYDRFKDQTTVRLKPQLIRQVARPREELSLSVEAVYEGERQTQPREVELIFDSVAERYIYYDKAELIFIIDGERLEAGTAYMTNALPSPDLVKVSLKLIMPFDTFTRIAHGKEIDLKLGLTELRLSEKVIASLRAFASAVENESK